MESRNPYLVVWERFRTRQSRPVVYFAASLISGLVIAALAIAFTGVVGLSSDAEVIAVVLLASSVWYALQVWIWRRLAGAVVGGRWPRIAAALPPILNTIVVSMAAVAAANFFDLSAADVYLIPATMMFGAAMVIVVWLPTVDRIGRGRPLLTAHQEVNVNCPDCGYSLIGLRDLRCPECGTTFTIDELIRAQGYEAVNQRRRKKAAPPAPFLTPEADPDSSGPLVASG